MSIEQTLERIAAAVETLVTLQKGAPATSAAPMPGPSGTGPGQLPPQAAPAPVAPAPVAPAPVAPAPVAPAPVAPAPVAPAPVAAPPQVAATGLLDQIREAANAFHRAHPERAGEVWQIITGAGSPGRIDGIPVAMQAQVLQQIQALGA